jgi:putative ABC transport system substrate-binding protein
MGSRAGARLAIDAFNRGLASMGFVDKRNVAVEYRMAEGRQERLPGFMADLIRRGVAVICTTANQSTLAAKAATSDIPIVFGFGLDPVQMGLVSAINRPGGNATGVAFLTSALVPKSVELVRELLPSARLVAALVNPSNPNVESHRRDLHVTARAVGLSMLILEARDASDFDVAFATLVRQRAGALLVTSDGIFNSNIRALVDLAARNAVLTVYPWRDFVDGGGLLSYGNSLTDAIRQVGVYAGRILKGEKPAEMPVWVPTKFELVANLKTAKALGISIPNSILVRADEVIE